MILSKRLETVLAMTAPCERAADIGTDHGFTPIELVRRGIARSALAMDVRSGPLRSAAEHVAQAGLQERIELRLSDGLEKLSPGEADTVLMTGMGGPLMERLLAARPEVTARLSQLVLSPQSQLPHFRAFLLGSGCRIEDERMLREDGKYYTVMRAVPGISEPWTDAELAWGRPLLARRDAVLRELIAREIREKQTVAAQLCGRAEQRSRNRLTEIEGELQALGALLRQYYGEILEL